jgi:hypothetical protein
MNSRFLIYALFLFVGIGNVWSQNEKELKDLAFENAQAASNATISMDFETVLKYTLPSVVELMGGKEAAVPMLTAQFDKMTADGFVFEKAEVKRIVDFRKENDEYRCIVESYNEMRMPEMKINSKSFLLGVYNQEVEHWYFVETKQLKNPSLRELVLPDFQTEMELPEDEMTTEMIEKTIESKED